MLRVLRLKRFWLTLLLPLSIGFLRILRRFPYIIERFYSHGLYRILSGFGGRIVSLFPFSLTTVFLFCLLAALPAYLIRKILRNRKAPPRVLRAKPPSRILSRIFATFCGAIGVLYFLFVILCAPNYHRLTFAQQSGLEIRPSSADELAELCRSLVIDANAMRPALLEDTDGIMQLSSSPHATAKRAQALYPQAAKRYPQLGGYVVRPKPTSLSRGMSWIDIGGIYNLFFFEPNVNVDMSDFYIPCTMMHEMSHFKGYMREEEANFLAYITCTSSDDPEFIYSGTMLALIHSSNALYRADRELYYEVMGSLSPSVYADLEANYRYWQQFAGPVAQVSNTVNDVYLRSNAQQSGVRSYGEMVDLLLADFRANS